MNHPSYLNRLLEVLAVVLNLLYTFFYLNSNPVCFLFGILGPLALLVLCVRNQLYAEPLLQIFYVAMAVYGYCHSGDVWQMKSWSAGCHLVLILAAAFLSVAAGFLLSRYTAAKLPYADSVITVFAIAGTWLMVNYVHESWLYLLAINALSIIVYMNRKLYVGAGMFILYLLMSVDGYFQLNWFAL